MYDRIILTKFVNKTIMERCYFRCFHCFFRKNMFAKVTAIIVIYLTLSDAGTNFPFTTCETKRGD